MKCDIILYLILSIILNYARYKIYLKIKKKNTTYILSRCFLPIVFLFIYIYYFFILKKLQIFFLHVKRSS